MADKYKINMGIVNFHVRRQMLTVGMVVKIKVFRDLHKRIYAAKPPLKPEEVELLQKVTHEQANDFMQQRVFRGNILDYYRERLFLFSTYGRGSGRELLRTPEEEMAEVNLGARAYH